MWSHDRHMIKIWMTIQEFSRDSSSRVSILLGQFKLYMTTDLFDIAALNHYLPRNSSNNQYKGPGINILTYCSGHSYS